MFWGAHFSCVRLMDLIVNAVPPTCNPIEQNDPDCCEQSGSADAEPREAARPPRSGRRAHSASSQRSGQNMPRTPTPHRGRSPSRNTVAPSIYRLDDLLSAVFIYGTKPGVRPGISTSASSIQMSASTPDIPTAPACRRTSAAGAATITLIDPEHRLLPPVSPPRCAPGEGVFLESQ